jgi:proteasome assembly chaperone (PAC2) family protein
VIEFEGVGVLRDPMMIAAFEGWNDAADAATAAVEHLEDVFDAHAVGAVDPDDYYDFQVNRPTVAVIDDSKRRISWPTTRISVARMPGSRRDLVLVRGLEPNMRWRGFCSELVEAVHALGVDVVATLGALLADTPHTRPVPVSGTASDPATASRLNLDPSRYEGPTGIVGVFQEACTAAAIPAVSFWAAVPHYVAQPPCPKATLALLRRVEDLLDVAVPVDDLVERARSWEHQVDELAAGDSDVADYVRSLESREPEETLPEASGDAIAAEFERYLRRRGNE